MRDRGKKKEGQRNVLPPQIFNGDDYIGVREKCRSEFLPLPVRCFWEKRVTDFQQDFEDFDLANEDDVLEEFLGIERENPKES